MKFDDKISNLSTIEWPKTRIFLFPDADAFAIFGIGINLFYVYIFFFEKLNLLNFHSTGTVFEDDCESGRNKMENVMRPIKKIHINISKKTSLS